MTLKILQFVPESLPTFRADVATLFGKYMPRHGVVCDIVGKPSREPEAVQGFARARRPQWRGSRAQRELQYVLLCVRAMLSASREEHAAVQVRDMVTIGLLGLAVSRWKKIPFYYWVSYLMCEGRIENARASLARRKSLRNHLVLLKGKVERVLLYKVVLPAADHVFVQSDAMLGYMEAKGVPAHRMTSVPMGVDMETLRNRVICPSRLPGWEGVPVVGYLGTLDGARNLERVVDAMCIVRKTLPAARLLLIGNSPLPDDETRLLAYAAGKGLDGEAIRITGWLPSTEAWQLLAASDVAVSYIPRGQLYDVSSPTKLLEYLALGIPAVGNDTPDQDYVLQRSQAGWLTASTPEAMAEALLAILGDPSAARARAAVGPAFIEQERSYQVLAEKVAGRYQQLQER
ncbi:glycosyltransferase [Pseudoduganella lutea]|uniref:Glycosyltransferase n=1 Tax=Pseudoduganella lutea TaxID=321985 RepID=A0A4P6KTV2_9BURK|nr:glycosyltransferase [Pseudoduganella lutea]QBE62519.1 glycosyltransferase [Pseudoduganella lutea]